MGLDARRLDRQVTLLRVAAADDGFSSDAVPDAVDVGTRWMGKRDVSDGEQLRAGALGAALTTRFQARWDALTSSMKATDRLSYAGIVYEIVGTKEIGRRDGVEFTTRTLRP